MEDEKAVDKDVGGGVDREKLDDSDFVIIEGGERKFPIVNASDVKDAISSWGRYKGDMTFEEFKRRLIRIAKRKGLEDALPDAWKKEEKSESESIAALIAIGAKNLYDAGTPEMWCGVSHNAWVDRIKDILPLALIEDDIMYQRELIAAGKSQQYGEGLWIDHNPGLVIGTCLMREIVDGGRSCFEMGQLLKSEEGIDDKPMSIGYRYYVNTDGSYAMIYVYERSVLKSTTPVNARTFFRIKRRESLSDAAVKSMADELAAFLEER